MMRLPNVRVARNRLLPFQTMLKSETDHRLLLPVRAFGAKVFAFSLRGRQCAKTRHHRLFEIFALEKR